MQLRSNDMNMFLECFTSLYLSQVDKDYYTDSNLFLSANIDN